MAARSADDLAGIAPLSQSVRADLARFLAAALSELEYIIWGLYLTTHNHKRNTTRRANEVARRNEMRTRLLPVVALGLGLAVNAASVLTVDAKGGGAGMGGGAAMGGAHAGAMPATSNAGGQVTGPARANEVSGDQGNGNSADTGNSANGAQSATASTTTSLNNSHNVRIAAALAALNASHASATTRHHASSKSRLGKIAAYDKAMLAALAMPDSTPTEVAVRNAVIANARATLLATAANKPLTATVVATVDRRLGLPASDPGLGLTP
jgi:hypothetical protein